MVLLRRVLVRRTKKQFLEMWFDILEFITCLNNDLCWSFSPNKLNKFSGKTHIGCLVHGEYWTRPGSTMTARYSSALSAAEGRQPGYTGRYRKFWVHFAMASWESPDPPPRGVRFRVRTEEREESLWGQEKDKPRCTPRRDKTHVLPENSWTVLFKQNLRTSVRTRKDVSGRERGG